MGLTNIGTPQVGNRAIVQLAIEAGIANLIEALVPFGLDKRTLLGKIAEALESAMLAMQGSPDHTVHPTLNTAVIGQILSTMKPGDVWGAINTEVLDALLAYLDADPTSQVASVRSLPQAVPVAGPQTVTAVRDGDSVTVTFEACPLRDETGGAWTDYEIYANYRLVHRGDNTPVDGLITEALTGLPENVSIHVIYVDAAGNQAGTFSAAVTVS